MIPPPPAPRARFSSASRRDQIAVVATAVLLIDSFLPWYGAGGATANGWRSQWTAILAIVCGLAAGTLVALRLVGTAIPPQLSKPVVATSLGLAAVAFALFRYLTQPQFTAYGLYVAGAATAAIAYGATGGEVRGMTPQGLLMLARRSLGVGPIVAAAGTGGLLYLPTHSIATSIGTSLSFLIVIGALRAADPFLAPVWKKIGVIPRWVRTVIALALPILYSITRFGPSASGQEVSRARSTMLMVTVFSYIMMRPRKEDAR